MYSQPQEDAAKRKEKAEYEERYLDFLQGALAKHGAEVRRLIEVENISSEERMLRLDRLRESMTNLVGKIEGAKFRKSSTEKMVENLEKLHAKGIAALDRLDTDIKRAN